MRLKYYTNILRGDGSSRMIVFDGGDRLWWWWSAHDSESLDITRRYYCLKEWIIGEVKHRIGHNVDSVFCIWISLPRRTSFPRLWTGAEDWGEGARRSICIWTQLVNQLYCGSLILICMRKCDFVLWQNLMMWFSLYSLSSWAMKDSTTWATELVKICQGIFGLGGWFVRPWEELFLTRKLSRIWKSCGKLEIEGFQVAVLHKQLFCGGLLLIWCIFQLVRISKLWMDGVECWWNGGESVVVMEYSSDGL